MADAGGGVDQHRLAVDDADGLLRAGRDAGRRADAALRVDHRVQRRRLGQARLHRLLQLHGVFALHATLPAQVQPPNHHQHREVEAQIVHGSTRRAVSSRLPLRSGSGWHAEPTGGPAKDHGPTIWPISIVRPLAPGATGADRPCRSPGCGRASPLLLTRAPTTTCWADDSCGGRRHGQAVVEREGQRQVLHLLAQDGQRHARALRQRGRRRTPCRRARPCRSAPAASVTMPLIAGAAAAAVRLAAGSASRCRRGRRRGAGGARPAPRLVDAALDLLDEVAVGRQLRHLLPVTQCAARSPCASKAAVPASDRALRLFGSSSSARAIRRLGSPSRLRPLTSASASA